MTQEERNNLREELLQENRHAHLVEVNMRKDIDYCAEQCSVEEVANYIVAFEEQMAHYGWSFPDNLTLCDFILQWR